VGAEVPDPRRRLSRRARTGVRDAPRSARNALLAERKVLGGVARGQAASRPRAPEGPRPADDGDSARPRRTVQRPVRDRRELSGALERLSHETERQRRRHTSAGILREEIDHDPSPARGGIAERDLLLRGSGRELAAVDLPSLDLDAAGHPGRALTPETLKSDP